MFRFRRYRLFLLVAVLTTVTVYHLTKVKNWEVADLEGLVGIKPDVVKTPSPETVPPAPTLTPLIEKPAEPTRLPPLPLTSKPAEVSHVDQSPSSTRPPLTASPHMITGEELLANQPSFDDEERFGQHGQGRYEVKPRPSGQPRAYWRLQPEHFPIPTAQLIPLPSGNIKTLPKVQYDFGQESASKKADRVRQQTTIRESFKHAWAGYKNYSLPHDELKPVSKSSGDPFNGWGATLIDSLDTLWIMGLKDEFAEAVGWVKQIDFKTSARKDIPLFETTIRYLGGLIAAYDLSSGKYPVLLDKAVELADIMMGAFDTPNRMPDTYYRWAPSYASQPHLSNTHVVLAELGSLSVEFTRLAQITREAKYYDAVARITDALEEWQMKTTMPGLWPLKLDASGCKKVEISAIIDVDNSPEEQLLSTLSVPADDSDQPSGSSTLAEGHLSVRRDSDLFTERQAADAGVPQPENSSDKTNSTELQPDSKPAPEPAFLEEEISDRDCEVQGLSFEPHLTTHTYGIAAMADSTYEYFPKEYALLGGRNEQYRTMYENALEVVRKEVLYRPMTTDERDILFVAKYSITPTAQEPSERKVPIYEGTHLGCFAGGMLALGAKVFDIPDDLVTARKLTDGCVWAYESMPTGIMPEEFALVPCDNLESCPWNETKWHEALDPQFTERMRAVELYNQHQQRLQEQAAAGDDEVIGDGEQPNAGFMADPSSKKRDVGQDVSGGESPSTTIGDEQRTSSAPQGFVPKVALSHEEFVATRIAEERLRPGYTKIKARDYRLRPEAIESLFIMYRITGDEYWREKGWKMFTAIDRATKTEAGNAAVKDVTSKLMELDDTMESFWLAETLKYFYLLFSEPGLISLDDYVL